MEEMKRQIEEIKDGPEGRKYIIEGTKARPKGL
jgi:hypothetical protein